MAKVEFSKSNKVVNRKAFYLDDNRRYADDIFHWEQCAFIFIYSSNNFMMIPMLIYRA